jgi:hypothetical protein
MADLGGGMMGQVLLVQNGIGSRVVLEIDGVNSRLLSKKRIFFKKKILNQDSKFKDSLIRFDSIRIVIQEKEP